MLDRDQILFALASTAQILLLGVLYLALLRGSPSKPAEEQAYVLFFLGVPLLAFITRAAAARVTGWRRPGVVNMLPWLLLLGAAPALIVAAGLININRVVYYSYAAVPRLPPYSILRFAVGGTLGALLFSAAAAADVWSRKRPDHGPSPSVAVLWVVAIVLLFSLFDPAMMVDTLSYSPYVGPALAVQHGAVPMVDSFSQYGPNFVLFTVAFKVARTFYMASAIISLLNVIMGLALVAILTRLGRSRHFALAGGTLAILFLHAAFLYNLTYTPSVFAMRFLPPLLLVAALVRVPRGRIATLTSGLSLAFSSLWSIEAFGTAALVYGAWLAVRMIGERRSWPYALRSVSLLLLLVLLPHALWTLAYFAAFGALPRYDIYFELVFSQLRGSHWLMPVEAGTHAWILFAYVYGSALALVAIKTLDGDHRVCYWSGVAAASVLGIAQFFYYVGRSATPLLVFVAPPLLLLALLGGDWAVDGWRQRRDAGIPILVPPALAAGLAFFVFMGGAFADRFFEPLSRDLSNSTLLRACLPGGDVTLCSLRRMLRLVRGTATAGGAFPRTEAGGSLTYTHAENETEFEMIVRFTQDSKRRILLFAADPVPVMFHSSSEAVSRLIYPPLSIGVAYPAVDGLSPILRARVLASLAGIRAGDVLIRGALPIYELDDQVLSVIESRWRLCPVARVRNVESFELKPAHEGTCGVQ